MMRPGRAFWRYLVLVALVGVAVILVAVLTPVMVLAARVALIVIAVGMVVLYGGSYFMMMRDRFRMDLKD